MIIWYFKVHVYIVCWLYDSLPNDYMFSEFTQIRSKFLQFLLLQFILCCYIVTKNIAFLSFFFRLLHSWHVHASTTVMNWFFTYRNYSKYKMNNKMQLKSFPNNIILYVKTPIPKAKAAQKGIKNRGLSES